MEDHALHGLSAVSSGELRDTVSASFVRGAELDAELIVTKQIGGSARCITGAIIPKGMSQEGDRQ